MARAMGFDWSAAAKSVVVDDPGPRAVAVPSRQFVDTFPFDGRARLVDAEQGVPRYVPVAGPSIRYCSSRRRRRSWSTRCSASSRARRRRCCCIPSTPRLAGCRPAQQVRVFNDLGLASTCRWKSRRHAARRRRDEQGRVAAQSRRRLGSERADAGDRRRTGNGACFNDAPGRGRRRSDRALLKAHRSAVDH